MTKALANYERKAKKGANFQMLGQVDEISKLVSRLKEQAEVELPVDIVIVDLDLVFEKKDEELAKSPKIQKKLSLEDERKRLWFKSEASNKEIDDQVSYLVPMFSSYLLIIEHFEICVAFLINCTYVRFSSSPSLNSQTRICQLHGSWLGFLVQKSHQG